MHKGPVWPEAPDRQSPNKLFGLSRFDQDVNKSTNPLESHATHLRKSRVRVAVQDALGRHIELSWWSKRLNDASAWMRDRSTAQLIYLYSVYM